MKLSEKRCVPCEGGIPRLGAAEIERQLSSLDNWRVVDTAPKLVKVFTFENFPQAIAFINEVASLAEAEQHHPDITIRYNVVDVVIYTHAIGGLSENDFILAAKIDEIRAQRDDNLLAGR